MQGLLLSRRALELCGDALERIQRDAGSSIRPILLPDDPHARLEPDELERIHAAYFSVDVMGPAAGGFFSAVHKAPHLAWLHTFNTGVDHPIFRGLLERGVTITNYPIVAAIPIAQTAIAGLLMLARGFPHWLTAQREREWRPQAGDALPERLEDQTLVILGLGAIGKEIARLARAIGLRVVGVRRSPRTDTDPVDSLVHPSRLAEVLPKASWLAITCPLTEQTRGMVDRSMLRSLPRGARVLNVARGEIIDEPELIAALRDGHLGGAYLDVFAEEPLPSESPLWQLPNVIVTPHNAAASRGLEARHTPGFLENLERFARKQPLANIASS